ncbi:MAG: hypothetical protein AB7P23_12355, partial [Amphiplicatus sp.]
MKRFLAASALALSSAAPFAIADRAHAATSSGHEVTSVLIYADGSTWVKTNPLPDISGLSCTNNGYLWLTINDEAYEAVTSAALSANMTGATITIQFDSPVWAGYCKLYAVET